MQEFLTAAAVIIALATAAGLGLQRGVVTNLREQLNDARSEITDLKTNRTETAADNARLKSDLSALQRVVTGEVHWLALNDLLDHHHKLTEEHWRVVEPVLTEIRDLLLRRT